MAVRGPTVQHPPLPEREPLVGGFSDQCVGEDQVPLLLAHELREAQPQAIVELHVVLDDWREELFFEARAQDGGGPQCSTVGGGQAVDPGRQ